MTFTDPAVHTAGSSGTGLDSLLPELRSMGVMVSRTTDPRFLELIARHFFPERFDAPGKPAAEPPVVLDTCFLLHYFQTHSDSDPPQELEGRSLQVPFAVRAELLRLSTTAPGPSGLAARRALHYFYQHKNVAFVGPADHSFADPDIVQLAFESLINNKNIQINTDDGPLSRDLQRLKAFLGSLESVRRDQIGTLSVRHGI